MENIFVCVDGSDYSVACCEHAVAIAKPQNAHVDVLYASDTRVFEMSMVHDFLGETNSVPYRGLMDQIHLAEKAKASIIEKIVRHVFKKSDYLDSMNFYHMHGFLMDIVEEFESNNRGIDLIILGQRGEHFQNFKGYLGSTAERIIKSVGTPCLITGEKYRRAKEILIAYDGSNHARAVIRGILRTKTFFQGKVHLVTVESDEKIKEAKEQLSGIEVLFREANFSVTAAALKGTVDEVIKKYIVDHDIDMLAMGAFGRSGIRHLIAGSTTVKLLAKANVPTLIYRDES
ncbi:MAG: universal stress protein [Puniceicoccales bacterium]|jgi:nucleotide-binding universal stress UspA family protein|nr:universal stress protein [Puniceicoccales bacterium]